MALSSLGSQLSRGAGAHSSCLDPERRDCAEVVDVGALNSNISATDHCYLGSGLDWALLAGNPCSQAELGCSTACICSYKRKTLLQAFTLTFENQLLQSLSGSVAVAPSATAAAWTRDRCLNVC
jgi:hypothetical protein